MIQEFSLTNILSIKERQTLSFEVALTDSEPSPHWVEMPDTTRLLRMACIYGANASGKTNILKAYSLCMDFLLNGFTTLKPDDPIPVIPFQFDPDTPYDPSSFEIKFYLDGHRYIYAITMTRTQVISESLHWFETKQKKLVYRREANGKVGWGPSITGSKKQIATMTKQNVPLLTMGAKLAHPLLARVYQCLDQLTTPLVAKDAAPLMQEMLKQIDENPDTKSALLQLLSNASFTNIEDIIVEATLLPQKFFSVHQSVGARAPGTKLRTAQTVHSFNGRTYSLPIGKESEGTQRCMELALPLFDAVHHERMLLIDEIGSPLQEELLVYFIDTFLEGGSSSQLMFTTQCLFLLNSRLLRDDEVWITSKDAQGSTELNCFIDYVGNPKDSPKEKLYHHSHPASRP